jgi:hypothetical protein
MSDSEDDPEITQLLTDLTRTLRELEREVEPERPDGPRLPTPSELSRFASEVAIPGLILLLRTNIRALQLLRRALRLADGRNPSPDGTVTEARNHAEKVGRASLSQLDDVLSELQSSLEARPQDDEANELLTRARDLRDEIHDEMQETNAAENGDGTDTDDETDAVSIDIESELQSLKDNIEDAEDDDEDGGDDTDGDSDDTDNGGDNTGDGGDGSEHGDNS